MRFSGPLVYQHPSADVGKAQWLRVLDVTVLGPAMILLAFGWRFHPLLAPLWLIGGVFTIIWNAENFDRVASGAISGLTTRT